MKCCSALELLEQEQINQEFIPSGDLELDKELQGGIMCGYITEICGDSASGKSQFCFELILNNIVPKKYGGLIGGKAIYFSTKKCFLSERITGSIKRIVEALNSAGINDEKLTQDDLLKQIFYRQIFDYDDLALNVYHLENSLKENNDVSKVYNDIICIFSHFLFKKCMY